MLFVDDMGTVVEVMVYASTVNYFTLILREGRTYMVTNAQLHALQGRGPSSLTNVPLFWVLYHSTVVQPLNKPPTELQCYNPQFASFDELFQLQETRRPINYLGIVVGRHAR